jgi:peptidyl-prolyl cis-trans isomerase SurA
MQYKQRNFNSTVKTALLLFTAFIFSVQTFAQGPLEIKSSFKRTKIDGVSAVVGDYVILDSDIDKTLVDMKSQGIPTDGIERCQLLGKLMEDKLYAHHAVQDSLEISDSEVYSYVDQSIEYFTEQLGSIEKVLEFYNKPDELSFREQLFEINKLQKLAALMQSDIVSKIEITPEEVRSFFDQIPKEELPVFGTEIELAQIVIEPKVTDEETQRVVEKLKDFKNDVEEKGLSFASKAILYSQDPGSRSTGGKYTLYRKRPRMVKEFRDVAFGLEEGEISKPFKSDFGWHILTVDKIRGQQVDVRHILLTPKVDPVQLNDSKKVLDTIRKRIFEEEITFSDAAFNFSSEKETRNSGGVLLNPVTGDTRFELTKMDPTLYNQVSKLKEGEISLPLLDEDRSGLKKYKIIKITNRFDEHVADYSQDYTRIKELALKDKQLKAIEKWTQEKIEDTYVSISKDYRACEFTNNWSKK